MLTGSVLEIKILLISIMLVQAEEGGRIGNLQRENGEWVIEEEEKREFITNYFLQLFSTSVAPAGEHLQQLLSAVQPSVSPDINAVLTEEFTSEEVKAALENIGDLKAPGPDGMPAIFFKKYWDVVGDKLTKEVLDVLRGGTMPEVTDLRPISLLEVVGMILSSV